MPIPVQHRWVRTWSPDGRRLGLSEGVAYDLASRTILPLSQTGQPVWLADSRRLIMESGSDLNLVDYATGRSKRLLSFESKHIETRSSVAPNNRTIYFTATSTEADIWLATLK